MVERSREPEGVQNPAEFNKPALPYIGQRRLRLV